VFLFALGVGRRFGSCSRFKTIVGRLLDDTLEGCA
jgi:hypothetical protein